MTHTPGPWIHDKRGYPHPDVKSAGGRNIACTWGVNNQPKTPEAAAAQKKIARANARLIAAAPDLLEALEAGPSIEHALPGGNICNCSHCQFVRLKRAAIAKATGSAS